MATLRMTAADVGWTVVFLAIFLPAMTACLLIFFALAGPSASGGAGAPPKGPGRVVGILGIICSGALSGIVSLWLFSLICRRFLSAES